jgi:hypothetical protein
VAAGTVRKVLGGCLLAAAGFCVLLIVLFAAYVGWGVYANQRAERQAAAFCSAAKPGQPIALVLERARGEGAPTRSAKDGEVYHFWWYGMIFNARECVVTSAAGRVVSTQQVNHED